MRGVLNALIWVLLFICVGIGFLAHHEEAESKNPARIRAQIEADDHAKKERAKEMEKATDNRRIVMGQLIGLNISISRPDDPSPTTTVQAYSKAEGVPSNIFVLQLSGNQQVSSVRVATMEDLRTIPEFDPNEAIPSNSQGVFRRTDVISLNLIPKDVSEFRLNWSSNVYGLEKGLAKYLNIGSIACPVCGVFLKRTDYNEQSYVCPHCGLHIDIK